MQKSQKLQKQYEHLGRQISSLLKDFERNRQWADIGNWLSRLSPILAAKKHSNLPHKIQLAKRLAQCLNPSLPAGVHSTTLAVYNTILNNFDCKNQLLPIFSIGLFPFFENSISSSLKVELIKIFQAHFIQTTDCLQMLTSMINVLLTGLNESNEELVKRIYALCDKIANSYGRMWVDGAVWINILKSPKTRLAGFKYFMKTFKDRDKSKRKTSVSDQKLFTSGSKQQFQKQKIEQKQQPYQSPNSKQISHVEPQSGILGSVYDSFISDNIETEANIQIFSQISKIKNLQDNLKSRFPNFSTLVVSALSQCLQSSLSDNLVKRSALDLMIFYLKLDEKQLISERDGIHIVSVLLQLMKIKQYSLNRRIYTYLFGQPNSEGIYHIDDTQHSYELHLIQVALQKMFKKTENGHVRSNAQNQGNLMILQILFNDHQALRSIILPKLSYHILNFLRISNLNSKRIVQFSNSVIQSSNDVFIKALQNQIMCQKAIQDSLFAKQVVATIDYFYSLKEHIETQNKSQISQLEIKDIIQCLLRYLVKTNISNQKIAVQILDLCNKFINFIQFPNLKKINEQSITLVDQLITLRPQNSVYARLLTLHPNPHKQTLLPYMNQISLSIVCLGNLLQKNPQLLEQSEKKDIFFAMFNLLNCHLYEDQGIQFIGQFKNKYPQIYNQLINKVQPSQWLIYWKKKNGQVDGGVIRMLNNLQDQNSLNKQLSKKWLENSKQICSRVIDPVYKLIKQSPIDNMKNVYRMIQKVFLIQKSEFITFFFLQKQRYLLPLIEKIFQCIQNGDEELKAKSISMLQFLMQKAGNINQKISFIQNTMMKSVLLLRKILGGKGNYERQIETLQYFISMVDLFKTFKDNEVGLKKLINLVQQSQMYETIAMGMKQTNVPYVRTLYIDYIQKSVQAFADITKDSKYMSQIITIILQKLFLMLRQNDVTSLEQIIKGKSTNSTNKRKKSQISVSIDQQSALQSTFNVQAKYAQIIQLWNAVKFLVNVSIKNGIGDLPIQKLLSLILQSFPFSDISYEQISADLLKNNYEQLQQQIRNMTGLKKEVLEIFETLWDNYQIKIINFLILKGDPRVLIHGSVDPTAVIKAITKSSNSLKINKYFKATKLVLPRGILHYTTQVLLIQNQINYFLYLYLLYCNLSFKNQKSDKKITGFIQSTLNLLKSIKISTHIQTKLWIVQILFCLYQRVSFRELHAESSKIKLQFQEMAKQLIQQIIYVVAKSRNFTHRVQIKTGLFNIFGKQQEKQSSLFDFIKIFPPTIYRMSTLYSQANKNKKSQHIVSIDDAINQFLFNKWANLTEPVYIQYLSIACIKTLSKLYIPLILNIFENDVQKVSAMTRDWLLVLFPLYENKSQQNQIYLETVAQFLHVLLNHPLFKTQIMKNMRKNIYEIYMGNDFFKCTKNTLNNWKYIIDSYSENNDLLGQLLSRQGLFDIFTRKAESTRLKIKNFERVCFIIYSGRVDKYQNKLRIVLQSLNQVMKSQNPSPALLILILFCIRILFIRLSEGSLNKMFRSFWPSLITLLIQIFTKPVFSNCTNLLLAGLKVIQLIHALQLEQFNIHKWIFVYDYFGIRIDSQTEAQQLLTGNSKKILTPFKFNPILTRVLPQNPLKCTFIPEVWPQQSIQPGKRKIVVKQASIQSDEQLRNHALILLQYMIDLNQRRVTVVRQQIQDLIQADFISLDDYIFQIK